MTKKQLAVHNLKRGTTQRGAFVAPVSDGAAGVRYVAMPGGGPVEHGVCVFTGVDVTTDEFLIRMGETGVESEASAEWQRAVITDYLAAVRALKIGSVVRLVPEATKVITIEVLAASPPSPSSRSAATFPDPRA